MQARGLEQAGDLAGAVKEFALAVRSFPKTPWAPDALASLAMGLAQEKRGPEACRALVELDRRYMQRPPGVILKAGRARVLAGCGT
jgi:TolA-binding protein